MITKYASVFLCLTISFSLVSCLPPPTTPPPASPEATLTLIPTIEATLTPTLTLTPEPTPNYLETQFIPSGQMGDGEQGATFITINVVKMDFHGTEKLVTQIEYLPGPKGWAGIYWQYPDSNWGDQPGKSLTGAQEITFWAKGKNGSEVVEFLAGGITGKQYEDSFKVTLGKKLLSTAWTEYNIDISNVDLSNVIGAFAFTVVAKDNGSQNVIFYIAELQIINK